MMLLMGNIEPLHIPQSKKWKGLTVFCNRCKSNVSEVCKESGKPIKKGTDNFILAPEVNISRGKVMCNILSRSFAHYYKQLNTGNKLTFKSLRKANFTQLQLKYGDNARFISGHTSTNILGTRYVDHNAVALRALDIIKNEKEAARKKELEKLRIELNNNEQQKDINL